MAFEFSIDRISEHENDEDRRMFQTMLDDVHTSEGGKDFAKRMLKLIDRTSNDGTLRLSFSFNNFGSEPKMEEVGEFLKNAENGHYEYLARDGTVYSDLTLEFWIEKLSFFETTEFLQYLFDQNLFNLAKPYVYELYFESIPSNIAGQKKI